MKKETFSKLAAHLSKEVQGNMFDALDKQTVWGSSKINHVMLLLQIQYGFEHKESHDAVALFLD